MVTEDTTDTLSQLCMYRMRSLRGLESKCQQEFFLCKWKSHCFILFRLRDCPHSPAGPRPPQLAPKRQSVVLMLTSCLPLAALGLRAVTLADEQSTKISSFLLLCFLCHNCEPTGSGAKGRHLFLGGSAYHFANLQKINKGSVNKERSVHKSS